MCLGRSVFVDEFKIGRKQRNLASGVNASEVETTLRSLGFRNEMAEDRIP